MTLVMLIIGCIALTVGIADLITCIKDIIGLEHHVRERETRDRHVRAHELRSIAEHERCEQEAR